MTGVQWHPAWCDTKRCEATLSHDGAHISLPVTIAPDDLSTARVQIRLWRRPGDQPTYLELTVGDHAHGHSVRAYLSPSQSKRLLLDIARLRAADSNPPVYDGGTS